MVKPADGSPGGDPSWDRERGPSLARALWRYRWAVLILSGLCGSAGYVYAQSQPPVYEAVSSIKLRSPSETTLFRQERGVPFTDIELYLNSEADFVKSPDVLSRASALLGGGIPPSQIRKQVTAQSSTKILEVTVRARFEDPGQAAKVANAVTKAYEQVATGRLKATVEASVAQLRGMEADLRRRLRALPASSTDPSVESERGNLNSQLVQVLAKAGQIRADAAVYGAGIDRIEPARLPEAPASASPRRMAVIFGLLGLIAALVAAFWRSEQTRVVESGDDAAGSLDAPPLGELPRHRADTAVAAACVITAPDSREARDYEFIASTLSLVTRGSEPRVLLVTSPEASQAKSVIALNLALSAAQDQRPVTLVDTDQCGVLTRLLRAERYRGASDLVALSAAGLGFSLSDGSLIPMEGLSSFRFVPTGTRESNGRGVAESLQMAKVLAQLQQEADLVFVDGPPLRESPGGMKLAAAVDGVVLVVRRGTTLDQLRQTRTLLARAQAPIVGFVFDRSRPPGRWRPWKRRSSKARGRRRRSS